MECTRQRAALSFLDLDQPARVDLALEAGTYFVLVSDNGNNATGGYALLLQTLRASEALPLMTNVPATDAELEPRGDLDLYTFTLDTAARVVVQVAPTSNTLNPCVEVLTEVSVPVLAGGKACATFGGEAARVDVALEAGTYFVLVSDRNNDATGGYTLLLMRP